MTERVLFIDDERSIRNAVERNLGFDYEIDTAESGKEALGMLSENEYAVVFTDMRMPKMNGLEFLKQAKELQLPTVFAMLTGNVDATTQEAATEEAEVFRFLNKPCEGDELRQVIADALVEYEKRVNQ